MKKQTVKYSNEDLGEIQIIPDFLPRPEELILNEDDSVKVTLRLKKSSIDFFKKIAKSKHTPYQKMIRNLLDQYVSHFNRHSYEIAEE